MTTADDHCLALVREHDKDRFLSALFAPDATRPHLLALYAFDVEIARIPDLVSEPQIGLIRQQWWLDTLAAISTGEEQAHPVAQGLAAAVRTHALPVEPLRQLVIAREADLYGETMPSLLALETYLGETSSVLMQLAAMILAGSAARGLSDVAGLGGVAWGLSQLLRDPARRGTCLPPGVDLAAAIAHARSRLQESRRAAISAPPGDALPAFLPVSVADLYLDRIERAPDAPAQVPQFRRQFRMWWRARRNRF